MREYTIAAPLAGPALAGDDVIVAHSGRGGRVGVQALRPGRRRTLTQFSALVNQGGSGQPELTIDASKRGVAVGFSLNTGRDRPKVGLGQVQVAPLSGSAATLARCRDRAFGPGEVAVTGSVIGAVDLRCRAGVYTRSGFGARAAVRRIAFGAGAVRVAGRYVAAQRSRAIRVYDRTSGKEAFRVGTRGSGSSFDLASDGTLAVVDRADGGCVVRISTSAASAGRNLPGRSACGPVRVAGGRILLSREAGAGREQLVVTDLEGGDVRPVSPPFVEGPRAVLPSHGLSRPEDGVDFDGRRFAYFAPGCVHARLVAGPVPAAGAAEPAAADCPLTLASGEELRVDSKGTLTPPVTCPRGCLASATLRRKDGSVIDLGDFTVELPGSSAAGPRLKLVSENVTRLRRDGRTPVTLELAQALPDGSERFATAEATLVPPS